jgi:hypothetical protein
MNRRKAAIGYVTYVVAKEVGKRAARKRYAAVATPRRTRAIGVLAATAAGVAAVAAAVVAVRRLSGSGA